MSRDFVITRRVQFSETDRAGVLYFAHYYRFMEEAEHAFWRSMGRSVLAEVDGDEVSWPRVATSCEYFQPVRFEEELEVSFAVTDIGRCSVKYEVQFHCGGKRIALGRMTAVCCRIGGSRFQPISIPDPLRVKLESAIGSD